MKLTYAVVFEKGPNNWGGYIPDMLGCVSVGDTLEEMQAMIREAMEFHLEGMHEHGEEIPLPKRSVLEAMQFHIDLGEEADDPWPDYPVHFDLVEVEVPFEIELPQPAAVEA